MPGYSVLLYDGSLRYLARLPVVSLDAGQVANDVATAQAELVPRRGLWLDDVYLLMVIRFEAGRVMHIGGYVVQQATEVVDNLKRTWLLTGQTPLALVAQRNSANISTAITNAGSVVAQQLMNSAWRQKDTYFTVDAARADPASPSVTTQTGVLQPLSTIKDVARAAETNYGMDLRFKVNYDVAFVPSSTGITLRPVVWTGEYGADRRISTGVNPVSLYLTKIANGWKAVDDRSRQVTKIVGTGSATSYTNARALENPYGNRKEQVVQSSSSGASRVNSQSRTKLYDGRSVTRIQVDMALPPDRFGLGLGDVFSVNVNGQPASAWLNVIHYSWGSRGESVTGRLDVEIQKWT